MILKPTKLSSLSIICLSLAFVLQLCQASAASQVADENEVKAAFVYNFLKFVEWPEQEAKDEGFNLVMCRVGESELSDKLELLNGRKVNGRPIEVCKDQIENLCKNCNVVFISFSESKRVEEILKNLANFDVLTISDIKDFARLGGIIGLKTIDGRVRFDINLQAAEKHHLQVSSQLLKLASEVIK